MRPAILYLLAATIAYGQSTPVVMKETAPVSSQPRSFTVMLQTGFAETFQLTLGGMFGDGPAWQNRVTVVMNNATSSRDAVVVSGWQTHDVPSHANDWLAGIAYRRKIFNRPMNTLTLTGGLQKWRFPSVKTGANDWLFASTALYQSRIGRLPINVNSDAWTILYSPLPGGSLMNTQAWTSHPLVKSDSWSLAVKHGPSHTYSWNFYGTQGHRVVRYGAGLVASHRGTVIEAGYRKQWGLQRGIPNNNYWMGSITHSFNF